LKSWGFSTLCFVAQALFMMRISVSCGMRTGLVPFVSMSTVWLSIFFAPVMPCM
jgi:hypothetical protein